MTAASNASEFFAQVTEKIKDGDLHECPICLDVAEDPVLLPCGHIFCMDCINNLLQDNSNLGRCAFCRADFYRTQIACLPKKEPIEPVPEICQQSSTKLRALIHEIKLLPPSTKVVVFSQWTSMMNIIQTVLNKENIKFTRLDGSMTQVQRTNSLNLFAQNPEINLILLSLKAGGLGLTLTCANVVFVFDPWWCPAAEQQAIDRVHRLGQTKNVIVKRFIIKGTVEERIIKITRKEKTSSKRNISNDK